MKINMNMSMCRKIRIKSLLFASLCISSLCFASSHGTLVVQDFESPLSGWTSQKNSSIALTSTAGDFFSGSAALAWTYLKPSENDNWNNGIQYTFPNPQDWSAFDSLCIRIKSDNEANGKSVRIGLLSNGVSMSGPMPVAMAEPNSNSFSAVSILLSSLNKTKLKEVTGIIFYVNGAQFKKGKAYMFYIDQIGLSDLPEEKK